MVHRDLMFGHSQSPIDIRTACTIYRSFESFKFSSTYNEAQKFYSDSNSNSILLTLNGDDLNGTISKNLKYSCKATKKQIARIFKSKNEVFQRILLNEKIYFHPTIMDYLCCSKNSV